MAITIGMSSSMALKRMDSKSSHYKPEKLTETTGLTAADLQKALRMAENKTLRWVVVQFTRQLAGNMEEDERVKITMKALRDRIRTANANRQGQAARLWAGVYEMKLRRFGVGRPTGEGYTVGKRYEKEAFRAQMRGSNDGKRKGHEGIFRRVTSDRLPILEVGVPVKIHAWTAVDEIMDKAEEKLAQELKRAIKYLMLKKGKA